MVAERDGGLSTLYLYPQQSVLRIFLSSACLFSEDVIVWLWYFFVNLDIYIYIKDYIALYKERSVTKIVVGLTFVV